MLLLWLLMLLLLCGIKARIGRWRRLRKTGTISWTEITGATLFHRRHADVRGMGGPMEGLLMMLLWLLKLRVIRMHLHVLLLLLSSSQR